MCGQKEEGGRFEACLLQQPARKPLKVLYITEIFPDPETGKGYWGGGERQFYEISRRMAREGHEVTVLTCRFPGQGSLAWIDGVEVRRLGLSRNPATGGVLKSPRKIAEYVALTTREAIKVKSDIIHCNTYYPVIAGRVASAARRTPMVSTFHDLPTIDTWAGETGSAAWGLLGYAATLTSLWLSTEVVGVSEQTRKKLVTSGKKQVRVVPNGVDLEMVDSASAIKDSSRVLFVGRLVKYKRVDLLIRALPQVSTRIPEIRLWVVGDGPERPSLESLSASLAENRVTFTGTVASHPAVVQAYRESSLFVLPSIVEGEGIALKEAMAARVPVIAADAPGSGIRSLIKDGWNGLLVPPGDHHALADAMIKILTDDDLRQKLTANGRRTVEEWTWDRVASRISDVYLEALGRSRRGHQQLAH